MGFTNRGGGGGGGSSISQLAWNSGTETLSLTEDTALMWSVKQAITATSNQMLLWSADGASGGLDIRAYNSNGGEIYNAASTSRYISILTTGVNLYFSSYSALLDSNGWQCNVGGANALYVDTNRNVRVGAAALATTATNGFLMIPTCAGVPTGVVAVPTGLCALVFNSTANALYADDGGGWGLV